MSTTSTTRLVRLGGLVRDRLANRSWRGGVSLPAADLRLCGAGLRL